MKFVASAFASLALAATLSVSVHAQTPTPPPPVPKPDPVPQPGDRPGTAPATRTQGGVPVPAPTTPATPATPAPEKTLDETVKDFEKKEGVFTFYRSKKGATDTLYLEVPASKLDKVYLLQATASTGLSGTRANIFPGQPIADIPVYMKLVDDSRIVFYEKNLDNRASGDAPTQRSLDRAFPDTIIASLDIKARQKDRSTYLVDIGDFFKGDPAEFLADLAEFTVSPVSPTGGFTLDSRFTYIDSLKVFPENAVIRTAYRLVRIGPAVPPTAPGAARRPVVANPRSVPFYVSYNFSALPEQTAYRPRLADPRVGYFTTNFDDQSDPTRYDKNVNYIKRWNVEKADPNAPMSAPKKQIVWWIDNSVPVQYRESVRAGILMHNKSFEKLGIKDALRVEQMPDDADWDIADNRYNIIRWTTGNPFAIALFRANPVTGEILNAAINMDAGFASSGAVTYDITVDPYKMYNLSPELAKTVGYKGQHTSDEATQPWVPVRGAATELLCSYAQESQKDAGFGLLALEMLQTEGMTMTPEQKDRYIKQYIVEVVGHEMGHCLGLRHNFIASTEYTLDQLADPQLVSANGITASVMDYTPFNLSALKNRNVDYYSQTPGTYDMWAIEYGYKPVPGNTPQEELPALRQIASLTNLPGHEYQSDGTGNQVDPRVNTFDLSKDPLEYVSRRMAVSQNLMKTLDVRKPQNGQSYYEFTRNFTNLLGSYFNAATYATRYVGGIYFNNNFKGDPKEQLPLQPVGTQKQKQALYLLTKYIFSENAFAFPKTALQKLGANPNAPGAEASASERQYPIFDSITNFQTATLVAMFNPSAQNRIQNNEYRALKPTDTLTLASLYRLVGNSVWSELTSGVEVSAIRRDLQRAHLDLMIATARGEGAFADVPRDGETLAWEQLRGIRAQAAAALPKVKGEYGKAHLTEVIQRIDRTLKATSVINQ